MPRNAKPAINSTPAVLALLGVMAGIHVLRLVLPTDLALSLLILGGYAPSEFLELLHGGQTAAGPLIAMTPLTHAFLHADVFHLVINLAFLLAFGTAVDRRVGGTRFIVLFLVCVLCGAVLTTIVYLIAERPVLIVGASGGVSGLFGAYVRFGLRRPMTAILAFVGMNVVLAFTGVLSFGETQLVAWDAHIGGFFAGYLLYPLFHARPDWRGT